MRISVEIRKEGVLFADMIPALWRIAAPHCRVPALVSSTQRLVTSAAAKTLERKRPRMDVEAEQASHTSCHRGA